MCDIKKHRATFTGLPQGREKILQSESGRIRSYSLGELALEDATDLSQDRLGVVIIFNVDLAARRLNQPQDWKML
jgi:hypothetical protein